MLSSQRLWPRSCSVCVAFTVSPPISWSFVPFPVRMTCPDRQPCTPIAREQPIGGLGASAAGGVIGEVAGRSACPGIEEVLHGAPCCLNRIGPLEQGRIADHTIVDQRLVADRPKWREIVAVR